MLRKIINFLCIVIFACVLVACKQKVEANDEITVGTIAGPETELMEKARDVAKNCYGLKIKIIIFSDYNMPNAALNEGSIGANMFQHIPYLDAQVKARDYHIVAAGKTFIYPMGIYSKKITDLKDLQNNSKVAIPNDPSNQARALLLLQDAKLITLKTGVSVLSTVMDIASNPKNLKFVSLSAAQLPRALSDVAVAVINTNYAIPAGLSPKHALFSEGLDSPYANIVAVRVADSSLPKVRELMSSLHSAEVLAKAKDIFGDGAIPAWNESEKNVPCN